MSEQLIELEISTLVHGGRGLGRYDGKAVFVPLTAPGDRVRCKALRSKKNYLEADLVEVLEPSSLRREPPCPLFGECGGCQWQHLPYALQAEWKQRIFRDLLMRNAVAEAGDCRPLVTAPEEWEYRNRVQFKCRMTEQGFVIGFYRHGSHYVVDATRCRLLQPVIQECLTCLRRELPGAPAPDKIPQVDVTCSDDGALQLVVHVLPEAVATTRPWLAELAQRQAWDVSLQAGRKENLLAVHRSGCQQLRVDEPELTLQVSPGGFAQINPAQNRRLVSSVVELAELKGNETALDLFCGVGNFSLPLARRLHELIGVEAYAPAIADARSNAAANHISNVVFAAEDANGACQRYQRGDGFDLVVIDPPRTGCYQVMKDLLACRPQRIIYVSCDPATLVRDLKPLVNNGYTVSSSQPFDLFPQTWHIESVTCLQRNA